jgi:hypothetical protein
VSPGRSSSARHPRATWTYPVPPKHRCCMDSRRRTPASCAPWTPLPRSVTRSLLPAAPRVVTRHLSPLNYGAEPGGGTARCAGDATTCTELSASVARARTICSDHSRQAGLDADGCFTQYSVENSSPASHHCAPVAVTSACEEAGSHNFSSSPAVYCHIGGCRA